MKKPTQQQLEAFEQDKTEMIERVEKVKEEQTKFRNNMIFYFFCERVWSMIPNGNEIITFEEFMEKWAYTLEEMYLQNNYKQEKP